MSTRYYNASSRDISSRESVLIKRRWRIVSEYVMSYDQRRDVMSREKFAELKIKMNDLASLLLQSQKIWWLRYVFILKCMSDVKSKSRENHEMNDFIVNDQSFDDATHQTVIENSEDSLDWCWRRSHWRHDLWFEAHLKQLQLRSWQSAKMSYRMRWEAWSNCCVLSICYAKEALFACRLAFSMYFQIDLAIQPSHRIEY